jgi:hypothetical protein
MSSFFVFVSCCFWHHCQRKSSPFGRIDVSVLARRYSLSGADANFPFRTADFTSFVLPDGIAVEVQSDRDVPGPVVGAGLPGLILASGGLLGWWLTQDSQRGGGVNA